MVALGRMTMLAGELVSRRVVGMGMVGRGIQYRGMSRMGGRVEREE